MLQFYCIHSQEKEKSCSTLVRDYRIACSVALDNYSLIFCSVSLDMNECAAYSSHSVDVKTAQFANKEDYEAMYEALYLNEQASHVYEVIDK